MAVRLTLRKILAYVDDSMEPAQALEVGRRIAEDPNAGKLIERIRAIIRSRRLNAADPLAETPGLDPNDMAEYLDREMPGEAKSGFERSCLATDSLLAELASLHQLVHQPAGDAPELSAELYARLYGLEGLGLAASKPEAQPAKQMVDRALLETQAIPFTLPAYATAKGGWGRSVTVAAVVLLSLGLGLALWGTLTPPDGYDGSFSATEAASAEHVTNDDAGLADASPRDTSPAAPEPTKDGQKVSAKAAQTDKVVKSSKAEAAPSESSSREKTTEKESEETKKVGAEATKSLAKAPSREEKPTAPERGEAEKVKESLPSEKSKGEIAKSQAAPAPSPPLEKASPAPVEKVSPAPAVGKESTPPLPVSAGPIATLVTTDSLVFRRTPERLTFLPPKSEVRAEDLLLNPEGIVSRFRISPTVSFALVGETRTLLLVAPNATFAAMPLDGRIELIASGPARFDIGPPVSPLMIKSGAAGGRIFVDSRSSARQTSDSPPIRPGRIVTVYAKEGQWQVSTEQAKVDLSPGQEVARSATGALGALQSAPSPADPPAEPTSPARVTAIHAMQRALANADFEDVLHSDMASPQRETRRWAVRVMSVLDDENGLAEALSLESFADSRRAAAIAIRNSLQVNPGRLRAYRNAIVRAGHKAEPDTDQILVMLLGYSADAALKPATYARLIDSLESDDLSVQEVAIMNLQEMTLDTFDYVAGSRSERRAQSVKRWRDWLAEQTPEKLSRLSRRRGR